MVLDMPGTHFYVSKKKYQITFFGREWLFNAHSGGVWSVWEVAFFWLRVVQRNHIKRMQC